MPGDIKPPLFISHATRSEKNLSRARALRERLFDLLHKDNNLLSEDKRWDVFVDEERLNPGDTWRPIILQQLSRCRAGIILFDEWAVKQSAWVKAEAHILCFRKSIDPDFQLIPVLLDKLELKDTCFNEYEPFELNAINVVRDDGTLPINDLADFIINPLDTQTAINTTKELYGWMYQFKLLIAKQENEPLSRAWCALSKPTEIELNNIDCSMERMSTAIAQLMHIHDPLETLDAIRELNKEHLEGRASEQMSTLLKTKWVEAKTVEIVFNSIRHPQELGLLTYPICCSNKDFFITSLFERLQTECPGNFIIHTVRVSGATGETDEVIIVQIEKAIKTTLPMAIFDAITDSTRILPGSQAWKHLREKSILVICHVPSELARVQVLKEMRKLYPKIIFLVSLKNSEDADELKTVGAKILEPFNEGNVYDFDFFAGELENCGINLNWKKSDST